MNAPQASLACIAGLALSACATTVAPQRCASGAHAVINETLYFGTATPDGVVSPDQWREFVDTIVTPQFPMGMTVWSASGQWQSADGHIVHEPSHVLVLVRPDDARSDAAVRTLVDTYRTEFRQEAVLQVRSAACASP